MPARSFHSGGVPAPISLRTIRLRLSTPTWTRHFRMFLVARKWPPPMAPLSQQCPKVRSTNSPHRRSKLSPYSPAPAADSGTPPVAPPAFSATSAAPPPLCATSRNVAAHLLTLYPLDHRVAVVALV